MPSSGPLNERLCPHCHAANAYDLKTKCGSCRKLLPAFCFSCHGAIAEEGSKTCGACGRGRWAVGDTTALPCVGESTPTRRVERVHRLQELRAKEGRVLLRWRCLTCFDEDLFTDAQVHFPNERYASA